MTKVTQRKRLAFTLAFLGAASLFVCALRPGRAQLPQVEGGCAPARAIPAPSYDSFFGRQGPIEAESPEWRIHLAHTEHSPDCNRFQFQVAGKQSDATSQFEICDAWTRQIDEVDVVNPSRALILGRTSGAGLAQATVVDLPTGKVLDRFACFRPVLSPGHRFLAFIKNFPPHPGPAVITWEYIAYDLTRSADYNRPRLKPGVTYDAGWPVYPPAATNAVGENILPEGSPYHVWSSGGLFWLDDYTLAFSDFFQGQNLLVITNLSRGVRGAEVRTLALDPSQLVDLERCKKSTAPSDFEVSSKQPAGLIHIRQIDLVPGRRGMACLHFVVPDPCLRYTNLMVTLP